MSKIIKKKIKMPTGMADQNLADMFNQMLGAGSINMTIAYPRYKRIKVLIDQLLNVFDMVNTSAFMVKMSDFSLQKAELERFLASSKDYLNLFNMDFSEYEWQLSLVEENQKKIFSAEYEKIKKSDLVNTFIIMCDRLVPYKKFIMAEIPDDKFISSMAGAEFNPFPFTNLNLKYLFSLQSVGDRTKSFVLAVLNKSLDLSYKLWQEITSPDIDVDEFVDMIMVNIKEIRKRPELHRCGKAFKKIEESVHLLKGRFNNYYRDFIQTKNSTIMMEHFILDVSKNTKTDVRTTAQFRQIISFYRKAVQNQVTDPKIKSIFDKFNESFTELERNTSDNIRNAEESESDSDSDSDSEPEVVDPIKTANEAKLKEQRSQAQLKSVRELAAEIEKCGKK